MPSAQGTKSGRQHEYYSMCVCVSVWVARRQWETQTHTVNIHVSKERECMHILMHKLLCTWTKGYGTHNRRHFDGHRLRVTSAAKAAIQKALSPNQISVSVHVCSLRPLCQLPLGGWCFTGHYIVWHMGLFLSSVQETRPSGQPQKPRVLMQFPSRPVVFNVTRVKLGYRRGTANGVIGPSARSFCCVWLFPVQLLGQLVGDEYHKSMWQTHFLWIAHLHAASP